MEIALPALDTPAPARLELSFRGRPLFVEDDEELLRLVADRTWKSVEREEAIRQRDSLIAELRAAGTARSDELAALCQELRAPVVAMMASAARLLEAADRAVDRGAGPMSAPARTEVGPSPSAWAAEDHARARDDAEHIHFASERLLARIDRLLEASAPAPASAAVARAELGEPAAPYPAEDASSAGRAASASAERAATIVQAAGL
jgi:signal transduction histidine kinase